MSVVRAKAFLPERLALILSISTNAPPEGALEQITGGITVGPPNASITVTRLPDELTAALASADAGALHALATVLAEEDARTLGTTPGDGAAGYAAILSEVAETSAVCSCTLGSREWAYSSLGASFAHCTPSDYARSCANARRVCSSPFHAGLPVVARENWTKRRSCWQQDNAVAFARRRRMSEQRERSGSRREKR